MIATAISPGEQLKQWREAAGLDQKDIAEALDVKQQTVSNWERGDWAAGNGPKRDRAEALDRVLGLHEGSALFLILMRRPPTESDLAEQEGWRKGQAFGRSYDRGRLDALSSEVNDLKTDVLTRLEDTEARLAALEVLLVELGQRGASGSADQ